MAKLVIKSEKPSPFVGKFSNMEQFDSRRGIDSIPT